MKIRTHILVARICFVLYLAMVVYLCMHSFNSTPDVPIELWGIPTDKIVHFCMFFPFPILTYLGYDKKKSTFASSLVFAVCTLFLGMLVAAGTELAQKLTPDRIADIEDFYADSISLGLSTMIVFIADICSNGKLSKRKKR